jgi:hypothetical protein
MFADFPILFPDEHLTDVVWILVCGYTVLAFGGLAGPVACLRPGAALYVHRS